MGSNAEDPLIGRVLSDRYRLERSLGVGGMGAVYAGVDLSDESQIAVKVLRDDLRDDPKHVERFRREAEAASSLSHPHIVRLLGFSNALVEPAYIVMEYLSGGSLWHELSRVGALEPRRAARLMTQILSALGAAHAAGIVHRDVKPSNVQLDPETDWVRLLDFGIAKLQESEGYQRLTRTGVIVGTVRYASPEQAAAGAIDHRSDIFCAGTVLYSMLAGRPPFGGEGVELIIQVTEREAPDPREHVPDLDARLLAVVDRSMRKDPNLRFQSCAEMERALIPFATGQPIPDDPAYDPRSYDPERELFGGVPRSTLGARPSSRPKKTAPTPVENADPLPPTRMMEASEFPPTEVPRDPSPPAPGPPMAQASRSPLVYLIVAVALLGVALIAGGGGWFVYVRYFS